MLNYKVKSRNCNSDVWSVRQLTKYPTSPKRKPTSSSGLMMPNWTLLIVRNGHALSPEGGPCILSIQRDASFLGTPLCEQEQPLNNHHDSGQAANGDRKVSEGDIPGTSAVSCPYCRIICILILCKSATDNSLPFFWSTLWSALSASEHEAVQRLFL